jgi:hypothetical protein
MAEAKIVIGGIELNETQAAALRKAADWMISDLRDADNLHRQELGNRVAHYEQQLFEVLALMDLTR